MAIADALSSTPSGDVLRLGGILVHLAALRAPSGSQVNSDGTIVDKVALSWLLSTLVKGVSSGSMRRKASSTSELAILRSNGASIDAIGVICIAERRHV